MSCHVVIRWVPVFVLLFTLLFGLFLSVSIIADPNLGNQSAKTEFDLARRIREPIESAPISEIKA